MKFHQLRPGARFRFRGAVFRKVAPLSAASEDDGTHRLIPRSAEVVALGSDGEAAPERLPDTLPSSAVEAAIAQFLAACAHATTCTDPPLTDAQRTQLTQAFDAAGNDLLTMLAAGQ